MKKLVKNFVHRLGVHCESTALRNILEFHGFKFSEPMIFGLGSGLGFGYEKTKEMNFPSVGGHGPEFLDKNLCHNLGVSLEMHKTPSKREAFESLRKVILSDNPAMIHVDMYYLKYCDVPEHFGGHVVVIAGLDEERGIAYIADTFFEKLQVATLEELERARASEFEPFPVENKWFNFSFPQELSPISQAIEKAIKKTSNDMLSPTDERLGIKGIHHFADEVTKWPEEYPPKEFGWAYERAYIWLEEAGTGGGCFRYLYSKFLKEVSEILHDQELRELGECCLKIGQKWTKVANLIREIPSREQNSIEARQKLLDIAKDEGNLFTMLKSKFLHK
jgi:hypothetical protein